MHRENASGSCAAGLPGGDVLAADDATFATPGLPALPLPSQAPARRLPAPHRAGRADGSGFGAAMPFIETPHPVGKGAAPRRRTHSCVIDVICGECHSLWVKPCPLRLKKGRPWESMVGSGQFGTPWERMHWANLSPALSICCTKARGQSPVVTHCWACCWNDPPVTGSRCWQARWVAWSWELLTPICCALAFGTCPLLVGSGKFGTPWERMQWE
jgi:hypothetical protein